MQASERIAWGAGRIAFRSRLSFIQQQVEAGSPLTAIYEQIKDSLAGMSYNAFTYHARKHLAIAVKQRRKGYDPVQESVVSFAPFTRIESSSIQKGSASKTNINTPGKPAKFRPGPRVPDPRDLY